MKKKALRGQDSITFSAATASRALPTVTGITASCHDPLHAN